MSLLSEYTSLHHLLGFTLGFYKFFEAFRFTVGEPAYTFSYKWNDVVLVEGTFREEAATWISKPCGHINENPLDPCIYCGHQAEKTPGKKLYKDTLNGRAANFADDLNEFALHQKTWIESLKPQGLYIQNRPLLKEECQRRMNFFVQALHTHFAGKQQDIYSRKTLNHYLRDIRGLASLCLRD